LDEVVGSVLIRGKLNSTAVLGSAKSRLDRVVLSVVTGGLLIAEGSDDKSNDDVVGDNGDEIG